MQNVAYIKTGDGNITLVLDAKTFSIGESHPNYSKILDTLKTKAYDGLEKLLSISTAITSTIGMDSGGKVSVSNGQVFYNDLPMHNTVTERIMSFISDGLPTAPLICFLENLMANPMPMAVAELYDFLEHRGFPITEDGCFVGYKGVNMDYTDRHSAKFDNTPNITEPRPGLRLPKLDRKEVDPDRRHECSNGLHVGTLDYAQSFGARVVLVKVNPRDCVAVPKDHDCSKLRVCEYKVIADASGLIETPMHPMPAPQACDEEDDDEELWNEGDGFDDEDEEDDIVPSTPSSSKTTKRPACSYCGAKGGKAHDYHCDRPRKS